MKAVKRYSLDQRNVGHICILAIIDIPPKADSQCMVNGKLKSSNSDIDVFRNQAATVLDIGILKGTMNVHKHLLTGFCRAENSDDRDLRSVFGMTTGQNQRDRRVEFIGNRLIAV